MNRRMFLRAAVVAASTPAVVVAPEIMASIGNVIAQHREVKGLFNAAETAAQEILQQPWRPPFPEVSILELHKRHAFLGDKKLASEKMVTDFFDGDEERIMGHASYLPKGEIDRRLDMSRKERVRAFEIFRERAAVYDAWRAGSGFEEVDTEARRLADLLDDLDAKVLFYPCSTIDDVRDKVKYISAEYGDTLAPIPMGMVFRSMLG